LISNNNEKCFLEVKNVTLERNNKIAEFPDAVTDRGTKHLFELISTKEKGFDCCILYLIQRQDCKNFKIAENIDANYKMAFDKAIKAGVRVLCYDCKINNEEIKLNNLIKLI
jgi:sugar fermentation stimulation protein A